MKIIWRIISLTRFCIPYTEVCQAGLSAHFQKPVGFIYRPAFFILMSVKSQIYWLFETLRDYAYPFLPFHSHPGVFPHSLLLEIDEQSTWRLREPWESGSSNLVRSNNAQEQVSTVRHSIAGLSEQYPIPGVTGLFVGGDVG